MENISINNIDTFIEKSEKIRKTPISKKDIDRINEISRKIEIEDQSDDIDIPAAASNDKNNSEHPQV